MKHDRHENRQTIVVYISIAEIWPILSLKPCSCAQFAPGCNFAPGSKFTPGGQICTPLCRVNMSINCVHSHLDLIRNITQGTNFYKKFAVFECSK